MGEAARRIKQAKKGDHESCENCMRFVPYHTDGDDFGMCRYDGTEVAYTHFCGLFKEMPGVTSYHLGESDTSGGRGKP